MLELSSTKKEPVPFSDNNRYIWCRYTSFSFSSSPSFLSSSVIVSLSLIQLDDQQPCGICGFTTEGVNKFEKRKKN